jgi:hypothetical protein
MDSIIGGVGVVGLLVALILLLYLAVLAFLMPYFVYRIHMGIIEGNQQLESVTELLKTQSGQLEDVVKVLKINAKIALKQTK